MDYKYKCLLFILLINSLFFSAPNEGKHVCQNILHITSHSPSSQRKAAAAAAAKSLQSCLTLCDPIVGSPPGSPVPGILQARTLEWVASSFSNAWKWKVKVKSLSRVRLSATPWTTALQAPPSTKVLEFELQHQSFQWTLRLFLYCLASLCIGCMDLHFSNSRKVNYTYHQDSSIIYRLGMPLGSLIAIWS